MRKVCFILLILFFTQVQADAQPKKGTVAPQISLQDVNGKIISITDLRGKYVLIDFWASWCGPCRKSNKELRTLYNEFKTKGFEIYGISIDDIKAEWVQAIQEDNIQWLQVLDASGGKSQVFKDWKVELIPTSFLLDKEGKIVLDNPSKDKLMAYLRKNL